MANTDVTLGGASKTLLTNQERTAGFTHKFVIDHTDIDEGTGTTDTVTVSLATLPANFVVLKAFLHVTEAFDYSGGEAGTLTVQIGTDGDPNNFVAATSLITTGTPVAADTALGPASGAIATAAGSASASSDALEALFTNSAAGSPSVLNVGKLTILMQIAEIELA
jgi:hypothetical protein